MALSFVQIQNATGVKKDLEELAGNAFSPQQMIYAIKALMKAGNTRALQELTSRSPSPTMRNGWTLVDTGTYESFIQNKEERVKWLLLGTKPHIMIRSKKIFTNLNTGFSRGKPLMLSGSPSIWHPGSRPNSQAAAFWEKVPIVASEEILKQAAGLYVNQAGKIRMRNFKGQLISVRTK